MRYREGGHQFALLTAMLYVKAVERLQLTSRMSFSIGENIQFSGWGTFFRGSRGVLF